MTQSRYSAPVTAPPIRALVIHPDYTYEVRVVDQELAAFRELVGGNLEAVYTEYAIFSCNEDGVREGLPFNPMATYLWWKICPEMEAQGRLAGTVIVTGPADEAGDLLPVLEATIDLFIRMDEMRKANQDRET